MCVKVQQHGTASAPVAMALLSAEAVAMASTPWHGGSSRCHRRRRRGLAAALEKATASLRPQARC